jgi:hypothetical protein
LYSKEQERGTMAYLYGLFYEDEKEDVCFYLGKGSGNRKDVHFTDCRLENDRNKHKTRKIKKLRRENKNPHSKVLIDGLDDETAYRVEKSLLEREDIFENLTNVMQGGRGVNHTEETRRKISEKMSGENNPNYGKNIWAEMSEEAKRKQRRRAAETQKGKTLSEEHKRKISEAGKENKRAAKMTKEQAREVLWLAQNTEKSYRQIAENYPIGGSAVGSIKRRERWKDVSPKKPLWKQKCFKISGL